MSEFKNENIIVTDGNNWGLPIELETLFQGQQPRIYKQADATEAKLQTLDKQRVLAKYRY